MQELSSFQCYFILVCSVAFIHAQDAGPLFNSHSQLLQSFHNEVKSLEAAAKRVQELMMDSSFANSAKKTETQTEVQTEVSKQATENRPFQESKPFEVTVLANPNILRNGVLGKQQSKPVAADAIKQPEHNQQIPLSPGAFFMPFGSFFNSLTGKPNIQTPWWKGKNVCMKTESADDNKKNGEGKNMDTQFVIFGTGSFERCKQTANKYICTTMVSTPESTRTSTVTYECCEGYRREGNECVEVNLKNMIDTLEELGAGEFASVIKASGMVDTLASHNVTLFVPIDEAMGKHQQQPDESNEIRSFRDRRAIDEMWNSVNPFSPDFTSKLRDLVSVHVANSLLEIEDFTNEMVVNTSNNESTLRINIYPGRQNAVVTVNCARLTSWDNLATSSRIHTIDRVLNVVNQSVLDILQQPQFSQFRKYLEQTDLLSRIENATAVTVFAPTNDAWQQLDEFLKAKYAQSEGCLDSVLKHHILPLTLCSAPTSEGRLTTTDIAGELIRINTNDNGEIIVNKKVKVIKSDEVATNGVVHVVDNVLIPQSAKSVSDLLSYSNHTTFLGLLNKAGLTEEMNKAENLTLFVPTERVLNEPETKELLQNMDGSTLRDVLLYHAATVRNPTCDMKDDSELDTMLGGAKLHINMYDSIPFFSGLDPQGTVQCAALVHTDGKACHAIAHEVDRLLIPPKSTILHLIADNPQLSTFRKIIEGTDVEKDLEYQLEQQASTPGSGYTLLAPTDEAFSKLEEQKLTKLLTDKKFADQTVRKHILPEPLCCSGIAASPWPFTNSVQTLQGRKLDINRNNNNQVMFGSSVAVKCDVMAKDGILHIIDKVLMPQTTRTKLGNVVFGAPGKEIMLFGI